MNWFKLASLSIKERDFNDFIKNVIKKDPFFNKMFEIFDIPLDRLNNVKFIIKKLNGKNAKSNSKLIILNKDLFDKAESLDDLVHYCLHEITHWLTRQKEKDCYFSDPEEIQAFSLGMAWELKRGKSKEDIYKIYYPIISKHFQDKEKANLIYNKILENATKVNSSFTKVAYKGDPNIFNLDILLKDPYKRNKPSDGTGFNLHTPGEQSGFGTDWTKTKRLYNYPSLTDERSIDPAGDLMQETDGGDNDISDNYDGGDHPRPNYFNDEGFFDDESPLSTEKIIREKLDKPSDSNVRINGIPVGNAGNIYDKILSVRKK